MNMTQHNAARFGMAASRKWWSDARELAVSFDRQSLEDAIVAWIKLNRREEVASTDPAVDFYYGLMSEAFLSLYDSETINPVFAITDLGQQFIDEARRATGIGAQSLPAPKPILTPAQELEATVRGDWKNLSSKQIREKINNNRLYRETFERISSDLESAVTARVVIQG